MQKGIFFMNYDSLKKIYYTQPDKHKETYQQRFLSPFSKHVPVMIKEYNHNIYFPAFWYYTEANIILIEKVYRQYQKLLDIMKSISPLVLHQYSLSCIVDEVHSTSAIEGIHSTHRELKEVLEGKNSLHFTSIIKKYDMLTHENEINFFTCRDIRTFYDEFAHSEIIINNPSHKLDGKIFRADTVNVITSTGKILHNGLFPEEKIISTLNTALNILHDENIPILVRIAAFHYLFVYIHPFYDGNGRTARFIASYFLAKNFHYLPALRLSVKIREQQKKYYDLIHDTELEINCGDLTPFIHGFITFFHETLCDIYNTLSKKQEQLNKFETRILELFPDDKLTQHIYFALLHSSTFLGQGITMEELMKFTGKSRNTIKSKLAVMPENHLVIHKSKKFFYKLNPLILRA